LVLWVYLGLVLLALPLTFAVRTSLDDSFGDSLVEQKLLEGFDLDWWGEFDFESSGLVKTFGPSVVGPIPVLTNLERLADGTLFHADWGILATGCLFLLFWAFLSGGILDRYALAGEVRSVGRLFSRGIYYFPRLIRLLVVTILLYIGLFRWVAEPLHEWVEEITRDTTVEKTAIVYTFVVYLLVGLILILMGMVMDYAKISLVVQDRRSALLSMLKGLSFVVKNFTRCLGLYLLLGLVALLVLVLYTAVAPGPGQSSSTTVALAFLVGQLYLLARIASKLWFLAGQTALFQSVEGSAQGLPEPSEKPPVDPSDAVEREVE